MTEQSLELVESVVNKNGVQFSAMFKDMIHEKAMAEVETYKELMFEAQDEDDDDNSDEDDGDNSDDDDNSDEDDGDKKKKENPFAKKES